MKLVWILVAIVFVFIITYKPSTGTLNRYIQDTPSYTKPNVSSPRPVEPVSLPPQYEPVRDDSRYHTLQFGTINLNARDVPTEYLGAVIKV